MDVLSGHPSGYVYWNLHAHDVADELGSVSMKLGITYTSHTNEEPPSPKGPL